MTRAATCWLELVLGVCLSALAGAAAAQSPTGLRVGTFDSRAVALAYYRSPAQARWMQALTADIEQAKAAKDDTRVKDLETQGPARQVLMHQQVFSTGSIANITAVIADRLPAIAAAAGVTMVVSEWELAYCGASVDRVDLTPQVVALFNPDAATKKMLDGLRGQKPIALDDALALKA
jgi:hypothetical protein